MSKAEFVPQAHTKKKKTLAMAMVDGMNIGSINGLFGTK
jgi:hypothetical protein